MSHPPAGPSPDSPPPGPKQNRLRTNPHPQPTPKPGQPPAPPPRRSYISLGAGVALLLAAGVVEIASRGMA